MTGWHNYLVHAAAHTAFTSTTSGKAKAWGSAPRIGWPSPYALTATKVRKESTVTGQHSDSGNWMNSRV